MAARRPVSILLLVLLSAANVRAARQEYGITALKTEGGFMLVWNQPDDFFTLEAKGTNIRPLNSSEHVFFEVDGIVFQVQSVAVSVFYRAGGAGQGAQAVLQAHRDWESKHLEGLLGKKLNVQSSPVKLKGGGDALLWKYETPEGFNKEAKQQMYLSVANGVNVLLLNGVVTEKVKEATVEQFLIATAGTLKRGEKPFDLRMLQEATERASLSRAGTQRLAGLSGSVMPCAASQRSVGTISMASHGQPSRNAPSGPLLMHFWQPMHSSGSTSIRPNGG